MTAPSCARVGAALVCLLATAWVAEASSGEPSFTQRRQAMLRAIEADVMATSRWTGRERFDPRVLEALAQVPRHEFVPAPLRSHAYENRPLSIGYGQTISQPYIVALMTDLLEPAAGDVVLEVGTGSGYQAAVLAELVTKVFTMEILEPLGRSAAERLERLGYANIETRIADGYHGWAEHGPFDAIVVTAASGHIPPPLLGQLAPGGRMVIPVGGAFMTQQLVLVLKGADGKVRTRQVLPVQFVPLTGGH